MSVREKKKMKGYIKLIRYADDFIFLSENKRFLFPCIDTSQQFLKQSLKLGLHPKKIILKKFSWGIDFCGYIVLPHYTLPRTKTKRRMFMKFDVRTKNYFKGKIDRFSLEQTRASYFGYLSHANAYKVFRKIQNELPF